MKKYFRTILDWDELTEDIANIPDLEGRTPFVYCLTIGSPYIARDILIHPTAKNKFRLDVGKSLDRKSALHLVAEQGNTVNPLNSRLLGPEIFRELGANCN